MATPAKVISPEKQYELRVQLDQNLLGIIRNCKKLEAERDKKDGGAKALTYLKVAEVLKHDYYNSVNDVCISRSASKKIQDESTYHELAQLLEEHNELTAKIEKQKAFLDEVTIPSSIQWTQRVQRGEKTLEALENKLDTVVKQYGLLTTCNHKLHSEIDHMLIERMNFNKLWYGYIENLSKGKKVLMDVLEQATLSYNNRDEYVAKLNALRAFAVDDLRRHTQEMSLLQKRLDNDRQLNEFMGFKEQYRNMMYLLEKKTKKRNEQRMLTQNNINHYKSLLDQIQTFSGTHCDSNSAEFVSKYTSIETANMSTFNLINDLHREIEFQNNDLVYLQNAAAKYDLENINKSLLQIYNGITALFKICKCSKAPFLQLLGENNRVNDYNVLLHIQVLEEAIDQYLCKAYYTEKSPGKTKVTETIIDEDITPLPKHSIEVICPINPCPLCVDREMVTDVIDSLQFVHSKDAVKEQLTERLMLPDGLDRLHNVSACNLPKSREIIQKRFQ
ncbi:hypothetical protein RN001_010743 [Aquatica leii]|uniref:ODAD1 central coiled coil region domain-containing protein n=1 Tax=Aquatica leii TaxID=1421715 RepID=A0AAN7SEM7_9COLE|nr:hypothetical protein RN001_010743 [Aquatica leii]